MIYNKTKRGLEKAAGIVGLVVSILQIISCVVVIIVGIFGSCGEFNYVRTIYSGGVEVGREHVNLCTEYTIQLICGVISLALVIATLIYCAKIILTPVKDDGTLINRTGTRICAIEFTILTGNWVSAGLLIAVVCLKDYVGFDGTTISPELNNVDQNLMQPNLNNADPIQSYAGEEQNKVKEFTKNLLELKHLNKIGVIEDANFKKAVQKIVDTFVSEN